MKRLATFIVLALTCISTIAQHTSREHKLIDMAYAFGYVESRNNPDAVNGNCVGWLQITPIMVKEANRILGYECFYLQDRYDMAGSYAIFKVVMNHHNKDLDLRRACEIWNKRGGDEYYEKVKEEYYKLTKINKNGRKT